MKFNVWVNFPFKNKATNAETDSLYVQNEALVFLCPQELLHYKIQTTAKFSSDIYNYVTVS